jgi:hypothetical protein
VDYQKHKKCVRCAEHNIVSDIEMIDIKTFMMPISEWKRAMCGIDLLLIWLHYKDAFETKIPVKFILTEVFSSK